MAGRLAKNLLRAELLDESPNLFPENEPKSHVRDGHKVKDGIVNMVAYLAFTRSVRGDLTAHGALCEEVIIDDNKNNNNRCDNK